MKVFDVRRIIFVSRKINYFTNISLLIFYKQFIFISQFDIIELFGIFESLYK